MIKHSAGLLEYLRRQYDYRIRSGLLPGASLRCTDDPLHRTSPSPFWLRPGGGTVPSRVGSITHHTDRGRNRSGTDGWVRGRNRLTSEGPRNHWRHGRYFLPPALLGKTDHGTSQVASAPVNRARRWPSRARCKTSITSSTISSTAKLCRAAASSSRGRSAGSSIGVPGIDTVQ